MYRVFAFDDASVRFFLLKILLILATNCRNLRYLAFYLNTCAHNERNELFLVSVANERKHCARGSNDSKIDLSDDDGGARWVGKRLPDLGPE